MTEVELDMFITVGPRGSCTCPSDTSCLHVRGRNPWHRGLFDVGVVPDGRSLAACSSHSGRRFGRRVLLQVAAAHRCIRTADPVRCCCEDSKSELPLGR